MKHELLSGMKLTKVYGNSKGYQTKVLDEIDISIDSSEMVAIVGPSGAGKTTLLNILSGIDKPTWGEVRFKGQIVGKDINYREYMSQRGFVFQQFNLIDHLTALENVLWPIQILGYRGTKVNKKEGSDYACSLLEKVGLKEHMQKFPGQLSGGQQQRVAIARALSQHQIIFADEPTGALDHKSSGEIEELLHKINEEEQSTIIMVTHDDGLAGRCGRVIRIVDGKIKFDTKKEGRL